MLRVLFIAAAAALFAGCSSGPVIGMQSRASGLPQGYKGAQAFATGLRLYEDARYSESARNLQNAIYQGLSDKDRVTAHKHLAFIHCASGREGECRDEFGRALDIDPKTELTRAEAGHPRWGPVFRSVKAER